MQINTLLRYSNQGWRLWDIGFKLSPLRSDPTERQASRVRTTAEEPETPPSPAVYSGNDSLTLSEEALNFVKDQGLSEADQKTPEDKRRATAKDITEDMQGENVYALRSTNLKAQPVPGNYTSFTSINRGGSKVFAEASPQASELAQSNSLINQEATTLAATTLQSSMSPTKTSASSETPFSADIEGQGASLSPDIPLWAAPYLSFDAPATVEVPASSQTVLTAYTAPSSTAAVDRIA
jgi:hypothetical protein